MIRIEVAVTSLDEALAAVAAGADRLELCTHLEVGGITPPRDLYLAIREAAAALVGPPRKQGDHPSLAHRANETAIPVCVLVRPRAGDFVYTTAEFDALLRNAEWFHREGATVVVGVLNPDRTVDRDRCARLPLGSVFHRAFDEVPDRFAAMETLIELGFRRILTSGGAATAPEGAEEFAALIRAARGRIEILPGGGITPDNAMELVRRTGATWIHGSFRCGKPATDPDAILRVKQETETG